MYRAAIGLEKEVLEPKNLESRRNANMKVERGRSKLEHHLVEQPFF